MKRVLCLCLAAALLPACGSGAVLTYAALKPAKKTPTPPEPPSVRLTGQIRGGRGGDGPAGLAQQSKPAFADPVGDDNFRHGLQPMRRLFPCQMTIRA